MKCVHRRIFAALVVGCLAMACASRVERFAVREARLAFVGDAESAFELAWNPRSESEGFPMWTQKIERGGGSVVLSRRMYDSGAFAVFDDEVYEAISLVVPSIDEPRTFEIERDDILATYSWVSAVDPNYGCFGYARSGSVTIGPHDDRRVRVEMLVEVASKAREVHGDECRDLEISDDGTYEIKDFRDLTPWHGGPSRDPYWGTAPDPDPDPRPAAPDPSTP